MDAKLIEAWADRCGIDVNDERAQEPDVYGWPDRFNLFREGWEAAAKAQPAVAQEPVAWKIQIGAAVPGYADNFEDVEFITKEHRHAVITLLYAAPQSPLVEELATAVAAEREACALLCDESSQGSTRTERDRERNRTCETLAAAIRARSHGRNKDEP